MWASDDEAQTLEIVLGDDIAGVEVHLLYGVLEACDVITRSVLIKIQAVEILQLKRLMLPVWIWFTEIMM